MRDHPRGCGENTVMQLIAWTTGGSPPRMRGKLPFWFRVFLPFRITPADAGKTIPLPEAAFQTGDHPRGCGENLGWRFYPRFVIGSPPRMRGKRRCWMPSLTATGITPADAGKTLRPSQGLRENGDHPRGCGENFLLEPFSRINLGSPPRMRGKRSVG